MRANRFAEYRQREATNRGLQLGHVPDEVFSDVVRKPRSLLRRGGRPRGSHRAVDVLHVPVDVVGTPWVDDEGHRPGAERNDIRLATAVFSGQHKHPVLRTREPRAGRRAR